MALQPPIAPTARPSVRRGLLALLLAGVGLLGPAGCGEEEPTGQLELAASSPGRWTLPAEVAAAGQPVIRYDSPPPWNGGVNCTGDFTAGARELGDFLKGMFPQIAQVQGYSCRQNTANAAETSVHGTGRAIDVMIPTTGGAADNDKGDPVANWLVTHSKEIGVQLIIWDRTSWNGSRSGTKDRDYTGPNPHIDHLHVEVNTDGANRSTPFFTDGPAMPPPPPPPPPPATTTVGYLDSADCTALAGWAQDPDHADQAVEVHLYVDAAAGPDSAPVMIIPASDHRDDLCEAIGSCEHGFRVAPPQALLDGDAHDLYAYAIDLDSGESVLLSGAPRSLTCAREPTPTAPTEPTPTEPTEPGSPTIPLPTGGSLPTGPLAGEPGAPPPAAPGTSASLGLRGGCSAVPGKGGGDALPLALVGLWGAAVLLRRRRA